MAKDVKLTPDTTWFSGKTLYALLAGFVTISGVGITLTWKLAIFSTKFDMVLESTKSIPVIEKRLTAIEDAQKKQSDYLASYEKNSVGADTGGNESAPKSLTPPPPPETASYTPVHRPYWYYSIPKGWTIDEDGNFKKL